MERFPFSCACDYACVVYRTCKPGQRKNEYKHKERKLKTQPQVFSVKLAPKYYAAALAYITVMLMLA